MRWIVVLKAHLRGLAVGIPPWMEPLLPSSHNNGGVGGGRESAAAAGVIEPFIRLLYVGDSEAFATSLLAEAKADSGSWGGRGGGEEGEFAQFVTMTTLEVEPQDSEGGGERNSMARMYRRAASMLPASSAASSAGGGGGYAEPLPALAQPSQKERIKLYYSVAKARKVLSSVKSLSLPPSASTARLPPA